MKDHHTSPDIVKVKMCEMYLLTRDNKSITQQKYNRCNFLLCSCQLLSNWLVYIAFFRIIGLCQWNTLRFSCCIFVHCERWIVEVHHALDMQSIQLVDNLITANNISILQSPLSNSIEQSYDHIFISRPLRIRITNWRPLIPRLHDTTGCQTGCKPVVQQVWQLAVSCKQTSNHLSNRFECLYTRYNQLSNQFDNRLYHVNGA